jgi:hypothetical protein
MTDSTYIKMVVLRDTGKTVVWAVLAKEDLAKLGEIRWFGSWRCYAFFPMDAIFEQKCLREIADFIEGQTKAHRQRCKENKGKKPNAQAVLARFKSETAT